MTREEAIRHFEYGISHDIFSEPVTSYARMAIAALQEQDVGDTNVGCKWISVAERLPEQFVSVLGYMTDAGDFPNVRECYLVGGAFFFPALMDAHPVSHWMPLPEAPKEE